MEQKTIRQYRNMVRRRAFDKAWRRIGEIPTLLGIVVTIIIAVVATPPTSFAEFVRSGATMTALIFLLVFIILLLWYLSKEPVIIYNEQQGVKGQLEQENNGLKEQFKPKLELSYDDSESASHQGWGKNLYDFRVMVKNVGGVQLRDIKVEIKKTKPDTLPFPPVELSLMHDAVNLLNPGGYCFANVLETNPEGGFLYFYAKDKPLQYHYPIQDYEILVSASGDNSPETEKWFRFSVNPPDSEHAYKFEELDREQAETKQTDQETVK